MTFARFSITKILQKSTKSTHLSTFTKIRHYHKKSLQKLEITVTLFPISEIIKSTKKTVNTHFTYFHIQLEYTL